MEFLREINALTLIFVSLCIFALGYRFYGLWIAQKILKVDGKRITPALRLNDGIDYVPTNKNILFGHHFAAISAAGPLLGPVLAAQFGFFPGAIWILAGSVLAGAVHDMVILFASVRHHGRSLADIASKEIGHITGNVASIAILFILILTLAGLSIAVVNAMFDSPWGTFTVFVTIPIALIMGLYLKAQPNNVTLATIGGVCLLFVGILVGPYILKNEYLSNFFNLSRYTLGWCILIYGFIASVLPIWLLLCPRDYLSTYLKIGTILALALSIIYVKPILLMAPVTSFIHGGGPVIGGPMFPFLFITIACGAVSGFHAIIGSGTTPKMLSNEKDLLFVGYGAMLTEGFVAIMALIVACSFFPADYFAINTSPETFATLNMEVVDLPALAVAVRENITGRPGGAVALAAGMSSIFSAIPFMTSLTSYWYHFAIMFEAVFILTAIDTGTRVGRFFLQEAIGKIIPKFNDKTWWPGIVITSAFFTGAWGFLLITGDISSIWPLFGMSNQLLASCALIICTSMLIRLGRGRLVLVTAIPGLFMAFITLWAGYLQIFNNYLPNNKYLLGILGLIIVFLMLIVLISTINRWVKLASIKTMITDQHGEQVLAISEE